MKLYIDTTDHLIVGLLDEKGNWAHYFESKLKKNSAQLHSKIAHLLADYQIEVTDLSSAIFCAGPGSYTGMRLVDGIGQVFDWHDIETYSFYSFQVPKILGISQGLFYSNAFKGEFFIYQWDGKDNNRHLIAGDDKLELEKVLSENAALYTHFLGSTKALLGREVVSIKNLIKENPHAIFQHISEKKCFHSPFYYRSSTREFTPGKSASKNSKRVESFLTS